MARKRRSRRTVVESPSNPELAACDALFDEAFSAAVAAASVGDHVEFDVCIAVADGALSAGAYAAGIGELWGGMPRIDYRETGEIGGVRWPDPQGEWLARFGG